MIGPVRVAVNEICDARKRKVAVIFAVQHPFINLVHDRIGRGRYLIACGGPIIAGHQNHGFGSIGGCARRRRNRLGSGISRKDYMDSAGEQG